jgi:hypothetical protein
VCPNAVRLGRAGCLVRSSPTTFVYMQALVIGWALGGTRARSYCHFARKSNRCEAQHFGSVRRLVRRPATSHEQTRVPAMADRHRRWVLMALAAQAAVKVASELEIVPENTKRSSRKHHLWSIVAPSAQRAQPQALRRSQAPDETFLSTHCLCLGAQNIRLHAPSQLCYLCFTPRALFTTHARSTEGFSKKKIYMRT